MNVFRCLHFVIIIVIFFFTDKRSVKIINYNHIKKTITFKTKM